MACDRAKAYAFGLAWKVVGAVRWMRGRGPATPHETFAPPARRHVYFAFDPHDSVDAQPVADKARHATRPTSTKRFRESGVCRSN